VEIVLKDISVVTANVKNTYLGEPNGISEKNLNANKRKKKTYCGVIENNKGIRNHAKTL
jgi:hypothetical protein